MSTPAQDMQGRVALVTGAGNGIGKETARQLAARGARVGVNDLKAEFVDAVVAQIRAEGGQAFAVVQNIGTRQGIQAAVDEAWTQGGGRLDMLINNAAWVRYQSLPDIQEDTLERMLDVGFKSVIWGMQAAAARMDPERGGAIVNIASTAAVRSTLNSVVYSGIKSGVLGLTRAAAAELGARHIRVNAVCPSAVPTEGTQRNRDPQRDALRAARTPLGRLGTVEDIAQVVCFLASDQAGFMSAQAVLVDGGVTFTNL